MRIQGNSVSRGNTGRELKKRGFLQVIYTNDCHGNECSKHRWTTRPILHPSHTNPEPSAVSPGPEAGPAQVRDLILLQRDDSEKAKKEVEELQRKVLYLTGQYEDRYTHRGH